MKFEDARGLLKDADVLLFPRASVISVVGRSPYSHAGMIKLWTEPMVLEYREKLGGRAVTLRSQVERRPQGIDVYRPDIPDDMRTMVSDRMLQGIGDDYDWKGIFLAALLHMPFIRLFSRPDTDDSKDNDRTLRPRYCSAGVSHAFHPEWDLVPNMRDRYTEPGDLGRSGLLKKLFTITQ